MGRAEYLALSVVRLSEVPARQRLLAALRGREPEHHARLQVRRVPLAQLLAQIVLYCLDRSAGVAGLTERGEREGVGDRGVEREKVAWAVRG